MDDSNSNRSLGSSGGGGGSRRQYYPNSRYLSPQQQMQHQHMQQLQAQQQQIKYQQQQVQRQQQQVQQQQRQIAQQQQQKRSSMYNPSVHPPPPTPKPFSTRPQQRKPSFSAGQTVNSQAKVIHTTGTPLPAAPATLSRVNSVSSVTGGLPLRPPPSTMRQGNGIPGLSSQEGPPTKLNNIAKVTPKPTLPPPLSESQFSALLQQCDWKDKTMWVSRQVLGGNQLNGFSRATAAVQRVKKQRARQVKDKRTNETINPNPQAAEEELKAQVMNTRTAKRIKTEMEGGRKFCELLHGCIRSILKDMNQHMNGEIPIPPALGTPESTTYSGISAATVSSNQGSTAVSNNTATSSVPAKSTSMHDGVKSTLRKSRKRKLPPNTEAKLNISEVNPSGKRYTKKDHASRLFEAYRFRSLRKGDLVAARVTSRDLWILAQVHQDFGGPPNMNDFLQLSEAKREQSFRSKVTIKDVEDKNEGTTKVARHLVLPLPRSFSEAAEWCVRYKKSSRVYAMYPKTTSLYTATVVDNTTYCKDSDDIVVVVFDGDEPDETGKIPECHIPARFVTLIPKAFPGSEAQSKKKKSSQPTPVADAATADPLAMGDISLGGFDDLDDLDFDLGFS